MYLRPVMMEDPQIKKKIMYTVSVKKLSFRFVLINRTTVVVQMTNLNVGLLERWCFYTGDYY